MPNGESISGRLLKERPPPTRHQSMLKAEQRSFENIDSTVGQVKCVHGCRSAKCSLFQFSMNPSHQETSHSQPLVIITVQARLRRPFILSSRQQPQGSDSHLQPFPPSIRVCKFSRRRGSKSAEPEVTRRAGFTPCRGSRNNRDLWIGRNWFISTPYTLTAR
jgi:hypothetical protein